MHIWQPVFQGKAAWIPVDILDGQAVVLGRRQKDVQKIQAALPRRVCQYICLPEAKSATQDCTPQDPNSQTSTAYLRSSATDVTRWQELIEFAARAVHKQSP